MLNHIESISLEIMEAKSTTDNEKYYLMLGTFKEYGLNISFLINDENEEKEIPRVSQMYTDEQLFIVTLTNCKLPILINLN
jgi:hypothetical protein